MNKELKFLDDSLSKIEEKFKKPFHGKIISHYTSMSSLQSIISSATFWASNCMFLNDKSEIIHLKKVIKNIIKEKFPKEDINEFSNWVLNIFDNILKDVTKNLFIVSFSTEQDSLPLWSNYTFNYGCSLNLSFDKIQDIINESNIAKQSNDKSMSKSDYLLIDYGLVTYDDVAKSNIINEYLNILYTLLKSTPLRSEKEISHNKWIIPILKRIFTRMFMFASLTKEKYFKSENEIRLLCNVNIKENTNMLNFRENNGLVIPFIKMETLSKNGILPIKSITLGPRNNADKAKQGLTDFLMSKGYTDFEILESKIPLRY